MIHYLRFKYRKCVGYCVFFVWKVLFQVGFFPFNAVDFREKGVCLVVLMHLGEINLVCVGSKTA